MSGKSVQTGSAGDAPGAAIASGEARESASLPVVSIANVTKRYGDLVAVDDVSFEVHGEILGLLGANGAGKSTLLKMLVGLLRHDSGRLAIDGHDVRLDAVEARRLVGYLPEDLELYERLTGREFLRFVTGIKGSTPDDAVLDSAFDEFGILEKADHLIKEYSLGMRKKTGLIAAMAGSPRLLVLDEPLNALDAQTMRLVERKLEAFLDAGGAVILSSHVMGFVERVCSRVVVLRNGRISANDRPDRLREATGLAGAPFDDVFFRYALG